MNREKTAEMLLDLAIELLNEVKCGERVADNLSGQNCCCNKCHCMETRPNEYPMFDREPDGVKIIVDRPLQENYNSRHQWAEDMAKYRTLIDQAKKCDWENARIPEDIPFHVHANRRDWYDDHGLGIEDIKKRCYQAENSKYYLRPRYHFD